MDKKIFTLSVYNTITKEYEDVVVTEEVFNTYRRSYWNEDKNDIRHRKEIPFSNLKCSKNNSTDNFHEFASEKNNPEELLFADNYDVLNYNEQLLLNELYVLKRSERAYAMKICAPKSTIHKRKLAILHKLKKIL